jgi:hypothetical protein
LPASHQHGYKYALCTGGICATNRGGGYRDTVIRGLDYIDIFFRNIIFIFSDISNIIKIKPEGRRIHDENDYPPDQ